MSENQLVEYKPNFNGEIADLTMQSLQVSWDSYPAIGVELKELDIKKIDKFIRKVNEVGRFKLEGTRFDSLEKLNFIKHGKVSNAANLLFSKKDTIYNVHVGRFKTSSHIIDDKMYRGTLFEVVEDTMKYFVSQIKVAFEITGRTTQRTEIFEYPLPALRELVLNAVVHRDYMSPTDVQIKIFDNRITLFNPGKLFGSLTVEDFENDKYQAYSRNKLIAEAFYLTADIEKYGSGFRRIRNELKEYPTMKLVCEERFNGFLAEISYTEQKTVSIGDTIGDNRLPLLVDLIRENNKISSKQLSERFAVNTRTIKRDLEELKNQGKLKRIGAAKSGHWEIVDK